ncbi:MAG: DUF6089 family protein [Prolixibacteraceae bacterium]|jgi:hypothetical protein
MKQLLVIFLVGFLSVKALGQQSVDLGFFGGAGTYFGDMTKIDFQKSVNPAYGGFLRFNFNPRYALRFNVLNGTIGAAGEFDSQKWVTDPNVKNWGFNKNVLDLALYFEWNYMKYIVGDKETPWSTFIYGGVGMQMYSYEITYDSGPISGSEIAPTLPFGLGVKYNLSKKWGIGIEGTLRKTFSDKLDDLDDPLSYYTEADNVKVTFTDQLHNNDWTAYLGIHLVYKIISEDSNWELRTVKEHNMIDWGIFNKSRR